MVREPRLKIYHNNPSEEINHILGFRLERHAIHRDNMAFV